MTEPDRRDNPDAIPGAPMPTIGHFPVNGTTMYAEVRGSGPSILLIPGGAEDAEGWRPVAERLRGYRVVTYDRRGTLRSGREDWPGAGSAQHADDAAALLNALDLAEVVVFGASSAGIIALEVALRHPALVRRALVHEPGYFRVVEAGDAIRRPVDAAVEDYIERHPGDWLGAYGAFVRAAFPEATAQSVGVTPPPGLDWYARREEGNAEALMRDDVPILTAELPDEGSIVSSPVDVRFSHGTASPEIFREIVTTLARMRGTDPEVIEGAGHALYFQPDLAAAYIRNRSTPA